MKRSINWLFMGICLLATCALIFSLAACSPRGPATRDDASAAQAVANAKAGLDAFAKSMGVTYDAAAGKILAGVGEYVTAAAGKTALPAPKLDAVAILANPDAYYSAAVSTREHADGTWFKVIASAALGIVAPLAIAAGRFIPGIGPLFEPIASSLASLHWFGLSTTDQKAADAQVAMVAGHARAIASSVDVAIPGWREKLPAEAAASIEAVLGKAPIL